MALPERSARLAQELRRRILVLDGAMGTMIQARALSAADFGGPQLEGCNENLNLTRPDVITDIHAAYLDAGADLISTNTFGCAPYVLAEYGLSERCHEITLMYLSLAVASPPTIGFPGNELFQPSSHFSISRNAGFASTIQPFTSFGCRPVNSRQNSGSDPPSTSLSEIVNI